MTNPKSLSLGLYLISLGIIMLAFSYTSVPLYQLYCQTTGLGGVALLREGTEVENSSEDLFNPISISEASLKNSKIGSEESIEMNLEKDTKVLISNFSDEASFKEKQKSLTIKFNSDISQNLP